MVARKRGRPTKAAVEQRRASGEAPPIDEGDDTLEPGFLHDQGDGVRVMTRARPAFDDGEASTSECPDEAPPGWGDA
jgi:hypothetical protein